MTCPYLTPFPCSFILELPPSLPKISVGGDDPSLTVAVERTYRPGDVLNLTCTSAPSNPPAQLEWRVNGRQVGMCGTNECLSYCCWKVNELFKYKPK